MKCSRAPSECGVQYSTERLVTSVVVVAVVVTAIVGATVVVTPHAQHERG